MNRSAASSHSPAQIEPFALGWVLMAAFVMCCLAIGSRSFWIDEGGVVFKASLPTLGTWWQSMRIDGSANMQLPLHHLYTWVWEKAFGTNEFLFRAANVPWFLAGLAVVARGFAPEPLLQRGVVLASLISPLTWYYMNEARPYSIQISMSMVVLAAMYRLSLGFPDRRMEARWILILCAGTVFLSASGMLAMLWVGAYLAAALLSTPIQRLRSLATSFKAWWLLTILLLLAIGCYYLWTLREGARATAIAPTNFGNLFFIVYELFGFSGLGPGRDQIRYGGLSSFAPWLPLLLVYGLLLLPILHAAHQAISSSTSKRVRWQWIVSFLLIAAFILIVGVKVRFRVLGRHFSPVLPIVTFVIGSGLARIRQSHLTRNKLLTAAFIILALCSCFSLRFAGRHTKDDYRTAAKLAGDALKAGQVVWWSANDECPKVYHLPLADPPGQTNGAWILINVVPEFLEKLPRPDLVFVSRPDAFDTLGAVTAYVSREKFRPISSPTNFTIFSAK